MDRRYLLGRLLQAGVTFLGVSILAFGLLHAAPGDPALLLLPPEAPKALVEQMHRMLGLDRPLPVQYATYMAQLLHGNLGWSERFHRPVVDVIAMFLPRTLELAFAAMILSATTGMVLGVAAAVRRGSWVDVIATGLSVLAQSIPGFWLGVMLVVVFSVRLGWLPTSGAEGRGLILPTLTLSAYLIALIVRISRSGMLEVLSQHYVRTAVAKGLGRRRVVFHHALRNALLPIVTILGMQLGAVMGGAVITEAVFAWPGIGTVTVQAVYQRDYALVQGVVLFGAFVFVGVNLAVDALYSVLDPRIRVTS